MTSFFWTLNAWWNSLPESVRKALRDTVAVGFTATTGVLAYLNIVVPGSIAQTQAEALLFWTAGVPVIVAAIFAIVRVELIPAIINWLLGYGFTKTR